MACLTGRPLGTSGAIIAFSSPTPPSRTGWRRREKKAEPQVEAAYLDWALSDFSGYLAADELYDGPFCVLSAVDARRQRRLLYEVLDHDPTQVDILCFLARLGWRGRNHDGVRRRAMQDEGKSDEGYGAARFNSLFHSVLPATA